ncbi:hypothetical protein ABMA28_006303 [Loxostege sticticalis]|uniref:Farnesyl pyrophosphate synthase n=1 Tax=Loxostege sticticalis TaxID=481309 RepID=A0ABD0SKQ9_LOXSC
MDSSARDFKLNKMDVLIANEKHLIPINENGEKEKFLAMFPEIVSTVVDGPKFADVPEIASRVKKLMEYNSAGGNKARGLMTVCAYQILADAGTITEENMRLARILGWCVELFQTSLLLLDDMADKSTTRRGATCWYRLPDVGPLMVINDSLLLLTIVFDILKENFIDKPCYPEILYTFNETVRHLCLGQYDPAPREFKQFTVENFNNYSNHSWTYYTFKLPIYVSLLLANKADKNVFDNVEHILVDMALLLSMQNDYADCFGNEAEFGKAGNDIQEGKCTWLAVQALARCTPAQRDELAACYGAADAPRVLRVKQLYEQLELPALYHETERAAFDSIIDKIQTLPADNKLPPELLLQLFRMIEEMRVD